jgi:hypothetical protein
MPAADYLHCLTIDFADAPEPLCACFELPAEEIRDLLCQASRGGAPLLLLCCPTSLTLLSTSQNHVCAFRPVLARVRERTHAVDGWRGLRVRIASGSDAARQLVRQAIPASPIDAEIPAFVRDLRAAAELSSTCGAFSGELDALVRMTERAAERVWDETRLGHADSSPAEIELETLVAERIVEEELVAWQSSYPALRSSQRPISDADIGPFQAEEQHSMVRIRVASVLTKLRSA